MRDRIVAETRGNPLALLELPRGLTPAELAGGFGLPERAPAVGPDRGELPAAAGRRSRADTRRLLLVAAAEPLGDVALLWRAAERLGIGPTRPPPAEAAGLLEFGARVRFRHPLVRSAVYRAASPEERRRCTARWPRSTDPELDPDRRAWHRAQAAAGPDEEVAAELERSAGRAQARGGLAAAAAFLERAAELTPDPARRARARAGRGAGQARRPARPTRRWSCWPWPRPARSTSSSARASTCCAPRSRSPRAAAATPRRCCSTRPGGSSRSTPALARETYLDALAAAMFAGRLGAAARTARGRATAARAAPPAPPAARGSTCCSTAWRC